MAVANSLFSDLRLFTSKLFRSITYRRWQGKGKYYKNN